MNFSVTVPIRFAATAFATRPAIVGTPSVVMPPPGLVAVRD
jgi:hypothetical protein